MDNMKQISRYISEKYSSAIDENRLNSIVKGIKEKTNANDVYGAWYLACRWLLDNERLAKAFQSLEDVHIFHGHLTQGVNHARQELIDRADSRLKQVLNPEEYKIVHGSF